MKSATGRYGSIRRNIFERGIRVGGGFWLLLSAALLCGPMLVTLAVLLAAALHEGGHLAALAAFGVPVEGVRLGAMGAVIHARGAARLSYGRELCVTLAGPAVNLLCAPMLAALSARHGWDWGLLCAGAHAVLGAYNLLPIPPLDGARALYLLAACALGPTAGERVSRSVGLACSLALCALGAYLAVRHGAVLFLLGALGLFLPELGLAQSRRSVYNTCHG